MRVRTWLGIGAVVAALMAVPIGLGLWLNAQPYGPRLGGSYFAGQDPTIPLQEFLDNSFLQRRNNGDVRGRLWLGSMVGDEIVSYCIDLKSGVIVGTLRDLFPLATAPEHDRILALWGRQKTHALTPVYDAILQRKRWNQWIDQRLLSISIATGEIRELARFSDVPLEQFATARLSPDGRYCFFSPSAEHVFLVDMQDGRLLPPPSAVVRGEVWWSNHELAYFDPFGNWILYDAQTAASRILLSAEMVDAGLGISTLGAEARIEYKAGRPVPFSICNGETSLLFMLPRQTVGPAKVLDVVRLDKATLAFEPFAPMPQISRAGSFSPDSRYALNVDHSQGTSPMLLIDTQTAASREIEQDKTTSQWSLPYFYGGHILFGEFGEYWSLDPATGAKKKIFPPAEAHESQ